MSTKLVEADWIWKDGEFIAWQNAKVHLLSLAVQFGSSIFEGIRCYATPKGPAIFRLGAHIRRLFDSCRIYRMVPPRSMDEMAAACAATVAKNGLQECYIRPMVLRGYGSAGLNPVGSSIETYIAAWPWGTYLGEGALERGVDVCVSSWQRPEPNTFPAMAKAAGHYNNAQLIKMEAIIHGYADAIAVGPAGVVSEGSGQNLFLVRDGVLITPALDGTQLPGITRDSVLAIARDLDIPVREQIVPREMLYIADELFFTGTAAEVTPIRSVDRMEIGDGRAGAITLRIQKRFLGIVHGQAEDTHGWLAHVKELVGERIPAETREAG